MYDADPLPGLVLLDAMEVTPHFDHSELVQVWTTDGKADTVFVHNLTPNSAFHIFVDGIYWGLVFPGVTRAFEPRGKHPPAPYIVPRHTPLFRVTAVLHRKAGSPCYERSEDVYVPKGTYCTFEDMANIINDNLAMRGMHNGRVIGVRAKGECFDVFACHRQPAPSEAVVTPLTPLAGLDSEGSFMLRTKGHLLFPYPCERMLLHYDDHEKMLVDNWGMARHEELQEAFEGRAARHEDLNEGRAMCCA